MKRTLIYLFGLFITFRIPLLVFNIVAVLSVVGENRVAKDQRMTEYFNSLNPSATTTAKSFVSRWSDMQSAFIYLLSRFISKVYRHISNFNAGLVVGSTGWEGWWVLTKKEQRENIGKHGVLAKVCIVLIIDTTYENVV